MSLFFWFNNSKLFINFCLNSEFEEIVLSNTSKALLIEIAYSFLQTSSIDSEVKLTLLIWLNDEPKEFILKSKFLLLPEID